MGSGSGSGSVGCMGRHRLQCGGGNSSGWGQAEPQLGAATTGRGGQPCLSSPHGHQRKRPALSCATSKSALGPSSQTYRTKDAVSMLTFFFLE